MNNDMKESDAYGFRFVVNIRLCLLKHQKSSIVFVPNTPKKSLQLYY